MSKRNYFVWLFAIVAVVGATSRASAQADWRTVFNQRIEDNRKSDLTITVVYDDLPIPGAVTRVRQETSYFDFGSRIRDIVGTNPQYASFFAERFTWATPEFNAKWPANEPERDEIDYNSLLADEYNFCRDNNISILVSSIFDAARDDQPYWLLELMPTPEPTPTFSPSPSASASPSPSPSPSPRPFGAPNLTAYDIEDIQNEVYERLNDFMGYWWNRATHMVVIDGMLAGGFFRFDLGENLRLELLQAASQIHPTGQFVINEQGPLSDHGTYLAYRVLIADLQSKGVKIDAIGCKGHFGVDSESIYGFGPSGPIGVETSYEEIDPESIYQRLTGLSEFGRSIWLTEVDVADDNDAARAEKLEMVLRPAFAHPNVRGAILGGFWENAHWRNEELGERAHLVNADWTLNAAGERLDALMEEWHNDETKLTDIEGKADFRVFHGGQKVALVGSPESTIVEVGPSDTPYNIDYVIRDYPAPPPTPDPTFEGDPVQWNLYDIKFRRDGRLLGAAELRDMQSTYSMQLAGGDRNTLTIRPVRRGVDVPPIPMIVVDRGLNNMRTEVDIDYLFVRQPIKRLTAKNACVGYVRSEQLGNIRMTALADAFGTTPTYCSTRLMATEAPYMRTNVRLNGVILQAFHSLQQGPGIKVFSKKYRDRATKQQGLSVGGIGVPDLVMAYATGASARDVDFEDLLLQTSHLFVGDLRNIKVKGGPCLADTVFGYYRNLKTQFGIYKVGADKRVIGADIACQALRTNANRFVMQANGGDIKTPLIITKYDIAKLVAKDKRLRNVPGQDWIGGVVGFEDDATTPPAPGEYTMTVIAKNGDIKQIYGPLGVYGVFYCGVDKNQDPTYTFGIKAIKTKKPDSRRLPPVDYPLGIYGKAYVYFEDAQRMRFRGDTTSVAQGRFDVIAGPF